MSRLLLGLFLLMLAACSNAPVRIESQALADQVSKSPEHFIIAAVENNPSAFVARAGSTPRGYDTVTSYGPSQSARRTMTSLENDYGLREVSAWPIEPLHMHCAVLEIPGGTDRATLLEALSHDQRIKLAQPLQSLLHPHPGIQRPLRRVATRLQADECRRCAPPVAGRGRQGRHHRYRRGHPTSGSARQHYSRRQFRRFRRSAVSTRSTRHRSRRRHRGRRQQSRGHCRHCPRGAAAVVQGLLCN